MVFSLITSPEVCQNCPPLRHANGNVYTTVMRLIAGTVMCCVLEYCLLDQKAVRISDFTQEVHFHRYSCRLRLCSSRCDVCQCSSKYSSIQSKHSFQTVQVLLSCAKPWFLSACIFCSFQLYQDCVVLFSPYTLTQSVKLY